MNYELRIKHKKINSKTIIHDSRLASERALFMIRKSAGFTLIELLVVIAIIGILSAILMSNFIGVRQRARDGQRKSDLRQIQSALELYRSDIGTYPASLPACNNGTFSSGGSTYMAKVPCDPLNSSSYVYSQSGSGYTLKACLENTNDAQRDSGNTCSGGLTSYTLTNP